MRTMQAVDPRVATGVVGLDQVLGGGLPAEQLYLIQGDPGSGKTTLAFQFLLEGVHAGEPVLYITLSESARDCQVIAKSHGWSLDGLTIHEMKPPVLSDGVDTESYTVFHPGEIEINDLMKDFFAEANRVRPKRAVIDSLSEMRMLSRDPLKFRRHMLSIREFFSNMGCTVLILDAGRNAGDLQANTLPHGVINIEHASPAFGARRRRLIITKMRGVKYDDGYHDLKIEKGGVVVYPRLVAADHQTAFERSNAPSGLETLDRLCGGGLPRGTSTVLMGSAGTGKSTLAAQFVTTAAERGERSALFSFDETVGTLLDRCEGFGMPMRRYVEHGDVTVQQVDPGELSPGQFVHLVRKQVEERDARVIVIDSLNGYLQAAPDERFLLVQLHELLTYLAGRGVVTILVVAQHGLLGTNMNTAIDISYLADTVFLLRYFEAQGQVRKCISVLKKRIGTHESTIRELKLIAGGVYISEPLAGFHGVLTGVPTLTQPQQAPDENAD